jgi:hypothetical protein
MFREPFPWDAWQARLERLTARGLSASEIATEVSKASGRKVSRCAVLARLWRVRRDAAKDKPGM